MANESVPSEDNDLHQALIDLLSELLGAHVSLAGLEIRKQLPDYRVVLVELAEPRLSLAVKVAGPQAPLACPFDRTAALLEVVRQRTQVPVAQVLGMDVSCQRWPWRWLATTRLPGIQWVKARLQMNEPEREQAFTQLGEAVAQLHTIQFAGFGEMPPSLNLPASTDFVAAWKQRAEAFIPGNRLRAAFIEALEPREELFADLRPASLCYEDLHGYNLLFEPRAGGWQLSGVLDFDKAWAGCPESDLARLEFWDGMTGPAFWQAYEASQRIDHGYAQRKLLFQLFWCLEYAATTPRHQADTARVCRELGIPEISLSVGIHTAPPGATLTTV